MDTIAEVISEAPELPAGYRAVEVCYGAPNQHWEPLGVIIKAEVWIDTNGQLRVSDRISSLTDERGDVQFFHDQDGGDGSLHSPDVVAQSAEPDEFERMLNEAAKLPSVIAEYEAEAQQRCDRALTRAVRTLTDPGLTQETLNHMAIGDYVDNEGTPGAPSVCLDDDGDLVAWEPVPTSLDDEAGWDAVSATAPLPGPVVARIKAWQTRDDGRMTGAEFAVRRHLLGLTLDELAEILRVNPRTVRAWESERDIVPSRMIDELDELVAEHGRTAEQMATDGRPVGIIRDKTATATPRPRGWYVAAAARALVMEPDLEVEWM